MLESDLAFDFAPEWLVLRYDTHPFYRRLAGLGFHGVDFLLLHRTEPRSLWIEVKNYRVRYRGQTPERLRAYVADPGLLAHKLARKELDTAAALAHVTRWYARQWWWAPFGKTRLALARQTLPQLRTHDRVRFPLLHELPHAYLVVLELDDHYPGITEAAVTSFGESLQTHLRAMGSAGTIGNLAALRQHWA